MSDTFWTIISGVLVFVLSQLYNEYRLKPIQKYKELRAKISYSLTLYANLYMNPVEFNLANESAERNQASAELRKLAAEADAMAELRPAFCISIAKKDVLSEVSSNLTSLSNGFYHMESVDTQKLNEQCRNNIYSLLRMKQYKKRK